MPIDKSKYPPNWKEIALSIKAAAKWRCEECDRPCRKPGEEWIDFRDRLADTDGIDGYWFADTFDEIDSDESGTAFVDRPGRFVLTVAHLDHDTTNNHRSNLKALCPRCHLKHDAELHRRNASATRYRRREEQGQLSFLAPPLNSQDMERMQRESNSDLSRTYK